MKFRIEADGWALIDDPYLVEPGVRVCFSEAPDGRIEPIGVLFSNGVLSNARLSKIKFGAIEAVANRNVFAQEIRHSLTRQPWSVIVEVPS